MTTNPSRTGLNPLNIIGIIGIGRYTLNFNSIQHSKVFLVYNSIGLGLVGAQVAPEFVREVGRKIASRDVNTVQFSSVHILEAGPCIKISVTFGVRRS